MTERKRRVKPLQWVTDKMGDRTGKVVLDELPAKHDDLAAMCEWLTIAFNFDPKHPIIGGRLLGVAGMEVGVELFRQHGDNKKVQDLLFKDARMIYKTASLVPALGFCRIASDGELPTYTNPQCAKIAEAVRQIAVTNDTISEKDQILSVMMSLIERSEVKEGCTIWGRSDQVFEAIGELKQDSFYPRPICLIDRLKPDHFVVGADDFRRALRQELGPQRHGAWKLAAELIGWKHALLQGWTTDRQQHRKRAVVTGPIPSFLDEDPEAYDAGLVEKSPGKPRKP
jgi:hypothetical protein